MNPKYPFTAYIQSDMILLCVRWYLRYALSYRNLEEMMRFEGIQRQSPGRGRQLPTERNPPSALARKPAKECWLLLRGLASETLLHSAVSPSSPETHERFGREWMKPILK